MTTVLDRAQGALLGLAAADAASFPALYHRLLVLPRRRRRLWIHAQSGDEALVNKFPVPYTQSSPPSMLAFGPTDDAEQVALAADVVRGAGADPSADELFTRWWTIVEPQADQFWGSVADRSAVTNAQLGLTAPHTGNDNPHHFDDSAIARSVAPAIRWHHDAEHAGEVARRLASITNADIGVDGAAAFAIAIAHLVSGDSIEVAIDRAQRAIQPDSWLGRNWRRAQDLLEANGSVFEAIPAWSDEVVNAEYNFGNVVSETLPIAFLVARETSSFEQALGYAALVPKQADTMPAMVGALVGASVGVAALPSAWTSRADELRGICVPSVRGRSLRQVAVELLDDSQ